ncbi:MAG: hypothetical protein WA678_05825 [Rhabdochlamydiaceae bacterium]
MNLAINPPLLLLNCLERFEKQSKEITNRNELVELFCEQVLPILAENTLIDDLRKSWSLKRDQMNQRIQETEAKALEEIKETINRVKKAIGDSTNERAAPKLALIERLISGEEKWYGTPLYQILYDELKQLFEIFMQTGYADLCKNYAIIATHKTYMQTDPNQGERWVRVLEDGRTTKILSAEELEVVRQEDQGSLLPIPPDYHLIDEAYIEKFTFAPTALEAYAAMDASHWNRLSDPAVVWWYFESALWCWKTPEFYFDEVIKPKNGNDHGKHFKTTCEKVTWREVAAVRDRDYSVRAPVIFTENLFRVGLRTLVNAISSYLTQGIELQPTPILTAEKPSAAFDLYLDGNELWVKVTFENEMMENFYIQKFHEGSDPEGSALYKFVKDIINNPQTGEKKADLTYKWESASKHINRLKLPEELKRAFFGKAHSSTFQFKGLKVGLSSSVGSILADLRKRHLTCRANR